MASASLSPSGPHVNPVDTLRAFPRLLSDSGREVQIDSLLSQRRQRIIRVEILDAEYTDGVHGNAKVLYVKFRGRPVLRLFALPETE